MNKQKEKWLVDVPVVVDAFTRPHKLTKVFEAIRMAKPSILFIVSDGPRDNHPDDYEKIMQSRAIFEDIDWECDVHKIYYEKNQGMYGRNYRKYVLSKVDRYIRLEEDIVPDPTFFKFAKEMLEKYENDERISFISGSNVDGITKNVKADYFFSRGFSIHGFAVWKRSSNFFEDFYYYNEPQTIKDITDSGRHVKNFIKKLHLYPKGKLYKGHVAGSEFWFRFNFHANFSMAIVPTRNMIKSIGYGQGATNTRELWIYPKSIRKLFNAKTYPVSFPINHPKYMTENISYEKRVIKNLHHPNPIIRFKRYIEKIVKFLLLKLLNFFIHK